MFAAGATPVLLVFEGARCKFEDSADDCVRESVADCGIVELEERGVFDRAVIAGDDAYF